MSLTILLQNISGDEMEKSNYQMATEFSDFKPAQMMVLSGTEVAKIKKHFAIENRTDVELQNLRDFIVLFYSRKAEKQNGTKEQITTLDVMSGITGVIDGEKIKRGLPV